MAHERSAWNFGHPPQGAEQVLLGCVSYDPAVGTIWDKMRAYLVSAGCPFDFVLFTNYEQQVAALLKGHIDIAWNGPVAHVMAQHYAGAGGVVSLGMRDVDRDFVSVCVARKDAKVTSPKDVEGKVVATGASDSPQAHIVPLQWLKDIGVTPSKVIAFDVDLGKHGDTAIGEIRALEALVKGEAQVALLSSMMWERGLAGSFSQVPASKLKSLVEQVAGEGPPAFDHCQFDALASCPEWKRESFSKALFAMDMSKADHKEVMCLEGIKEKWMPHREEGYEVVRKAMETKMGAAASGCAIS